MTVVFTKINWHKYSSIATRDDGVSVAIPGFGSSKPLPHDVVHFITEDELGVDYGFWGCVAAGAIYKGMVVVAGKLRHDSKRKSEEIIKGNGQKISEAEILAGIILIILNEGIQNEWSKIQFVQKSAWRAASPSRPLMTHGEVKRICARLEGLCERWQALPNGRTLELTWKTHKSNDRTSHSVLPEAHQLSHRPADYSH
jgi:hypothetical protein